MLPVHFNVPVVTACPLLLLALQVYIPESSEYACCKSNVTNPKS